MRLGEILRHDGIVDVDAIDRALQAQRGLGGRIGTNLIEAGAAHPDEVANALARQKGVPAARMKHFEQIHASTLKLLPKHLAERHNAIPIGLAHKFGRELVVAFLDPDDIAAVDEVGFAAGVRVRPSVAPEFYIIPYLEKLYHVPPRRFLRTAAPIQAMDMDYGSGRLPLADLEPPPPESRRMRPSTLDLGWDEPDDQPPERARAPEPKPEPEPEPLAPAPPPGAGPTPPLLSADEALAAIDAAVARDEIGDALVGYLVSSFGCGAVLICKRDAALGWRGYFPGVDADTVESITIALGVPSVFRTAFEQREPFAGPPPPSGRDIQDRLWKHLRCAPPAAVVVAPVALRKRVVNLAYAHADALPAGAGDRLPELCAAAAEAFARLIQSKKGG